MTTDEQEEIILTLAICMVLIGMILAVLEYFRA